MFSSDADLTRADWPLLQNGAVSLFWNPAVLASTQAALAALDYDIAEISCGAAVPSFEAQMSQMLMWNYQFGYSPWTGNLNAFVDGVRGYPFGPSGRSALALKGFHHLVAADEEFAHAILDILEGAARDHLLWGKFLIVLVQTDDPAFVCPPVGGRSAQWNCHEWSNADRGL